MKPNSTKSTVSTRASEYPFPKAEDVCKIIGACREAGVSEFILGAMEIRFLGPAILQIPSQATPQPGSAPTIAEKVPEETIRAQQQAEEESLLQQELDLKDRTVAELLLADPLAAEELMMEGELEPAKERNGGIGDAESD